LTAKLPFSAVLLAGGDSKRIGTNKAFLELKGKPLIDIIFWKLEKLFSEVIIVTECIEKLSYLPAKLTSDIYNEGEKNPLRGIHAGLSLSTAPSSFVVACDMPFISHPLIRYMSHFALNFDVVVPQYGTYYQPLFAFYNKTTLEAIVQALVNREYKVARIYAQLNVKKIHNNVIQFFDPCYLSFFNVNSKEDYLKAKEYYSERSNTSFQLG
jgi:molybdopterin-guanine dinucleotide biosynthesis protein A